MPKKNGEAEILDLGVRVALLGIAEDEWIEFSKDDWNTDFDFQYMNANRLDAFLIIVELTRDWNIRNTAGAFVPFDKKKLLELGERLKMGERVSFVAFPLQTQAAISDAFWKAQAAVRTLPFVRKSPST